MMNRIILYKELKLIFERKKIFIYIILGLLAPLIMEIVFLKFNPIIPLQSAMQLMILFVAMLGSEFLYISLIDEIMYNGLDILLISPISKSKILFFKSLFPIVLTIITTFGSIAIHDCIKISTCVLFNIQNIVLLITAIIISIFGEWLCLLTVDEYDVNKHSLLMIVSYGIVICLFYFQNYVSLLLYAFSIGIILSIYYFILLKLLKLKSNNKINKQYFSTFYSNKKMIFFKIEFLRMICELRKTEYLFFKSFVLFLLPIIYLCAVSFQMIRPNVLLLWLLFFLYISTYMNKIVFPSYINDVINKIAIIRFIAGMKPYFYFYINAFLIGLIVLSVPLSLLITGSILLNISIPYILYFLTIVSLAVILIIFIFISRWLKNMKDHKIIFFVFSILSFFCHYVLFILFSII